MRYRAVRAASTLGSTISNSAFGLVAVGTFVAAVTVGVIGVAPAAADGELFIETTANGEPADSAPGPSVPSGSTVQLRYIVTVASADPLYDFIVTNESGGGNPNCDVDGDGQPDGTNGHPGPLSKGESFFCVASVVAGGPGITSANVGRVKAFDFDVSATFVHEDTAHYTTTVPPTTQAPTTAPPTTAPPTTAAPTTPPPTTASTTTSTAPSSTAPASTASSSSLASSSAETAADATTSSASSIATTESTTGADNPSPEEIAFSDDDDGFPWLWVVVAFAAGGAVATAVASHLANKNAAAPDQ